jgi:serine/threonine protein kinase
MDEAPMSAEEARILAEMLVRRGVVTREQLEEARGADLIAWLIERGILRAPQPPPEGERFGPYALGERIGRGGLAGVFKATDTRTGAMVALKVFKPRVGKFPRGLRGRFVAAAREAAALDHPNVVRVLEANKEGGRAYVAMEYVAGPSLRQYVRGVGVPRDAGGVRAMVGLLAGVASALQAAHLSGIVHRAVTSGNLLVASEGEAVRAAKVTDFGIVVPPSSDAFTPAMRESLDPPATLSPEQLRGASSHLLPSTDVFSLGCVLYEAVTGVSPFLRDGVEATVAAIQREEPEPPSRRNAAVAPALDRVILRCLRKDPKERYGTAEVLADDLGAIARGEPIAEELRPSPFRVGASEPDTPPRRAGAAEQTRPAPSAADEAESHFKRGLEHQRGGAGEAALEEYLKALKRAPAHVKAWTQRGVLLHQLKRHDEAIVCLTKAIDLDAACWEAFFNRGLALREKGDYVDAMTDFQMILENAPADWPHREQVQKSLAKAIKLLEQQE